MLDLGSQPVSRWMPCHASFWAPELSRRAKKQPTAEFAVCIASVLESRPPAPRNARSGEGASNPPALGKEKIFFQAVAMVLIDSLARRGTNGRRKRHRSGRGSCPEARSFADVTACL